MFFLEQISVDYGNDNDDSDGDDNDKIWVTLYFCKSKVSHFGLRPAFSLNGWIFTSSSDYTLV